MIISLYNIVPLFTFLKISTLKNKIVGYCTVLIQWMFSCVRWFTF